MKLKDVLLEDSQRLSDILEVQACDKADHIIHRIGGYDLGKEWKLPVKAVVARIVTQKTRFYVKSPDGKNEVDVHVLERNNTSFISTNPDSIIDNNLLNLPTFEDFFEEGK